MRLSVFPASYSTRFRHVAIRKYFSDVYIPETLPFVEMWCHIYTPNCYISQLDWKEKSRKARMTSSSRLTHWLVIFQDVNPHANDMLKRVFSWTLFLNFWVKNRFFSLPRFVRCVWKSSSRKTSWASARVNMLSIESEYPGRFLKQKIHLIKHNHNSL